MADEMERMDMGSLPEDVQQNLRDIFDGKILPPLYSDVIAKNIFNADVHPERLNYLLRSIAKDDTIDVKSSAANEAFRPSMHAKGIVTDIPSWLRDKRLSDLEIQKVRQDFIFTRIELYASEMLLLQYSVEEGQKKSELHYRNVKSVLIIVLMVESPEAFQKYDAVSENYIHRFTEMRADSGLSYPMKAKIIYVQLDKCLKQFREGKNAESADGKPDQLQRWLAMIADVNDEKVRSAAKDDETLRKIQKEMSDMAQDKEVRNMILQEKYDRMDWISYGTDQREEGRAEGRKEGRVEGRAEGRKEGRAEGFTQGVAQTVLENIKSMMKTLKLTSKQAMDALQIPSEEQQKYAAQL